ncbi:hypothetical protein [Phreatobacter stygius]|uniref:Uncharacterized protein n=1 Tax=Phreatobacter stygius TaxID=1940610 RepID=A0A4D7BAI4_9HYPH|nr:hypothetical protein [Phreatobacter stygius]QCI65122.1 hypothetical protein E8M01_13385 [Phreatobacter stygius]
MSLLPLALKALTTAAIVVSAAVVAERTRPFLAAMVLALPVSTGPAYVMLALDHDAPFIAAASLSSLSVNVSIVPAGIAYALLARRGFGLAASFAAMLSAWLATALLIQLADWTLVPALVLNAVVFGIAIVATWPWRKAKLGLPPRRRWYDIPLRVALVVTLVVLVVTVSERIGPAVTGTATLFPASFSSFILLMHRRLGGPVVAAAMINGLVMLVGFVGFLLAIHLFAAAGQVWTGLLVGLAVPVFWSLALLAANRIRLS